LLLLVVVPAVPEDQTVLAVLVALDFLLQQMQLQPGAVAVVTEVVPQVATLHPQPVAQVVITQPALAAALRLLLVLLVVAAAAGQEIQEEKQVV
jgi:hypothetical protein